MTMPNLTVPAFPDVPDVPGAPAVARNPAAQQIAGGGDPNATINGTTGLLDTSSNSEFTPPLTSDGPGVNASTPAPQWGLFDQSNNAVIVGDTTLSVEYMAEYKVADYPIEGGIFASYNKVKMPFSGRVTFAKGGSVADKTTFLSDCEGALASLYLYWLVTPEATYKNVNVVHMDYDRKAAKGAGLMQVQLIVEEIRVAPDPSFSNTANPSGVDPQNGGTVQASGTTHNYTQLRAAGGG